MPPTQDAIDRLTKALRLETPLLAVYDAPPSADFEPLIIAKGRACCFAYYKQWLEGRTLLIKRGEGDFTHPDRGCPGAQMAFGLSTEYPPFLAHFLTDGEGAPMGEGLKASPQLAQEYIDRAALPPISGDTVLIGPLRLGHWDQVLTVTFLVDPDRLAALMTLAAYWSSDPEFIYAPFSSGCGLLWRELDGHDRDRAVIGATDIAMRKYLPPNILCFSVAAAHFEKMLTFPDGAFLNKTWWNDLMNARTQASIKSA